MAGESHDGGGLLTLTETAARLGVTRRRVAHLVDGGHLQCVKPPGMNRRIRPEDLSAYIASGLRPAKGKQQQPPAAPAASTTADAVDDDGTKESK